MSGWNLVLGVRRSSGRRRQEHSCGGKGRKEAKSVSPCIKSHSPPIPVNLKPSHPFPAPHFQTTLFFKRNISRARRSPWVTTRGSSHGTWTTTTQVRDPVLGPTFADPGQLSGIERARRGAEVELNSIELELKTDSELKTRRWRCGR